MNLLQGVVSEVVLKFVLTAEIAAFAENIKIIFSLRSLCARRQKEFGKQPLKGDDAAI